LTAKNKSLAERIVGASLVVGIAHLCLKFAGLIQAKAATQFLDTNQYEPVLVVAFTGVIGTLFLIGEEVIGPSFLPIFMREMDEKGEQSAWDFTNVLLTLQAIILLIAVGAIMLFPDFFIDLFTDWSASDNPDRYALLRRSLVFLAPALFFLSIGSTTYMLLNGYKRFFLAAFGDASTKICVVISLVLGVGVFGFGTKAVLFGLLAGSLAKLLTHLVGMLREMRFFRPSLKLRNPAVKAVALLMLPLLAGIVFAKIRDNFNGIYSLSRYSHDPGLLMANDLGRKLFASIQWLVPYALQIALFPFLCELVDQNDREKLGEVLSTSCRHLLAVFVPASVLIAVLAAPASALIFLGGKADFQVVVTWAGLATSCYILVLPAAAMECVLMQGFFANRKMVSVTVIGILSSIVSVGISIVFIVVMKVEAAKALMTVSLGFVASRYLKSFALAVYLERSVPMFPFRQTVSFAVRLLIVAAVVGATTFGMVKVVDRVLPDGLTRAAATYEEAAGQGDSVTIARVHEVLYARFDSMADPDAVREISRAFKKAIRGSKRDEMEAERAKLLDLIPATAPKEEAAAAKAAAASYERVLAANTKAVSQVSRVKVLIKLVLATSAGVVAFLFSSFALRVKEPFEMVTWTLGKVLGKVRAKLGTTAKQTE
jgi:peptidoglycan biosynthesis protein MviN/MurJ (putative lipid II flippase)